MIGVFLEHVEIDALIFQNSFRHFHASSLLGWHRLHTFRPEIFFKLGFLLNSVLRFDHLGGQAYVDFLANPHSNSFTIHLM